MLKTSGGARAAINSSRPRPGWPAAGSSRRPAPSTVPTRPRSCSCGAPLCELAFARRPDAQKDSLQLWRVSPPDFTNSTPWIRAVARFAQRCRTQHPTSRISPDRAGGVRGRRVFHERLAVFRQSAEPDHLGASAADAAAVTLIVSQRLTRRFWSSSPPAPPTRSTVSFARRFDLRSELGSYLDRWPNKALGQTRLYIALAMIGRGGGRRWRSWSSRAT